ncbi:ABC transporter permease [Caproicibacter sp.]|uniref:ABC transporter permease n=1 Tax=Caproicibacter sp. TaxID=2814884 RepID=UPI003988DC9D
MIKKAKEKYKKNGVSLLLILPYLLFCILFLVLPMISIIIHSFDSGIGGWAAVLKNSTYLKSLRGSLLLALWTTAESSLLGAMLALFWANKLSRHGWFMAFINFGANNGGISLAFSFIALMGANGMLTIILKRFGIELYPGFQLASLMGLHWAYLSFLIPFMCMIFLPAVGCVRKEWFAAARTLGAGKFQYARKVAGPVLLPSFLSSATLVFLQSLGTYATAQAITDNRINLITLQIGYLIQMSVFNRSDANVLSIILLAAMAFTVFIYRAANQKAARWAG